MRSLVYFVATTLDGYIAGLDRGDPDLFPFEGPHVADLLAEFPEMTPGHARPALGLNDDNRRFDTIVMGRTTYDIGRAVGLTSPYPHLRQIVVSTSVAASPRSGGRGRRAGFDLLPRLEAVRFPVHAASPPAGTSAALCGLAADRL
jgi:dihydrofolate reductase